jgi:hypothetical protein
VQDWLLYAKHLFVAAIRATEPRAPNISEPPPPRQSPVARTRFKTLIYVKGFGVGAIGFNEQIFG